MKEFISYLLILKKNHYYEKKIRLFKRYRRYYNFFI